MQPQPVAEYQMDLLREAVHDVRVDLVTPLI
jgi:hypothetical protein